MSAISYSRPLIAVLLAFSSFPAAAIEPAYVQWGSLYLRPLLNVELQYVDNLYRSASAETSSWVLLSEPRFDLWLDNQGSTYRLSYELDDGLYSDNDGSGDDDYTDHKLRADVDHIFNTRNRLKAFAEYHKTHEARGTGLAEGFDENPFDRPIKYDHSSLGAEYRYGSWNTEGRLELSYALHDYQYKNFRDQGTRFFDYAQDQGRGTFFWNLGGKSAALLELRYFDTKYDEERPDVPAPDSEEYQLLAGGEWQATGKTRGSLKAGYYQRDFDSPLRDRADGFSWDLGLNWRPRSYSEVDLFTRRLSRETNGLGDFINSEEYGAKWIHDFRVRNRLQLEGLYADDEYRGVDRDDRRYEIRIGLQRKVRRWLDLGVGYRWERRDSAQLNPATARDFNYKRNSFHLTLDASL